MFDKDITIINKYYDKSTKINKYKVSHIKGYWSSNEGITINDTQLIKQNSLNVNILMSVSGYQEPKDFEVNPTGWTLQKDDYLVKGKVEDFTTITNMLDNYREIMKIVDIATKDYGSKDMWHWEISGI